MKELLEIYDQDLKKIGIATRQEVHSSGLLHAVSHLWITDLKNNSIYLQLRSSDKDCFPNMYDITSAGHIDLNETPTEAIIRETKEEIGLSIVQEDLVFLGCIVEHFENDHEIAYIYTCDINNPTFILGEEVVGMYRMNLSDFIKQEENTFLYTNQEERISVSKVMICPHDVSLLKSYLLRKMK